MSSTLIFERRHRHTSNVVPRTDLRRQTTPAARRSASRSARIPRSPPYTNSLCSPRRGRADAVANVCDREPESASRCRTDRRHGPSVGWTSGDVSPRREDTRVATASAGPRTTAAGTPCASSAAMASADGALRGPSLDLRVQLGCVRHAPVARREALVVRRAPAGRAPRILRARRHRVGAQSATWPSRVAKMPKGASRGTVLPVRIAMPARSIVSHGSVAATAVSAPRSETSTCWPRPVCSRMQQRGQRSDDREQRAGEVAERDAAAHRRVVRAPRTSASAPLSAWKIVSIPLPGSPGAEPADRRVDDPLVDRRRKRVADTEPIGCAGAVVLDDHVGVPHEIGEDAAASADA